MQSQLEYDSVAYPPRQRGAATAVAAVIAAMDEAGKSSKLGGTDVTLTDAETEEVEGDECECGDPGCDDGEDVDYDVGGIGCEEDDPLQPKPAADPAALGPSVTTSDAARVQTTRFSDTENSDVGVASSIAVHGDGAEGQNEHERGEEEDGDDDGGGSPSGDEVATDGKKKRGQKSASKRSRSRSQSAGGTASNRLEALSKPRAPQAQPEPESFQPEKRSPKKPQKSRPSLLLRFKPTNLEEARDRFFASGFSEAPVFSYAYPEDVVTKYFEENNHVCFELLNESQRIVEKVIEYGGADAFMKLLYSEDTMPAEELRDVVADYLKDHGLEDKAEIRVVESMLSAANVVKPAPGEKYIVNISSTPLSKTHVTGICDHEIGTHLLRMMNDEHQVWHGRRERYSLANPWTTEEGFATLNTYISMPCKLMYPQALRYWAVCRGAQLGFVELFREIHRYVSNPRNCWQMCCRIKRGMIDTSLPGAFYLDQAYFKGAVEILRHLDEVDFGRLYGGQIALQDIDKVYFILRKEVVRLPNFLNSAEKLKTYKAHCRRLIRENQIEVAMERVCKQVFVRTAKEFFKPKNKSAIPAAATVGSLGEDGAKKDCASLASRSLDLGRLEDLARPRAAALTDTEGTDGAAASKPRRDLDRARLFELSVPRPRKDAESASEAEDVERRKTLDLKHLQDLAKPRQLAVVQPIANPCPSGSERRRDGPNLSRLLELAAPRALPRPPEGDLSGPSTSSASTAPVQKSRGASAPPADRREDDASGSAKSTDGASKKARSRSRSSTSALHSQEVSMPSAAEGSRQPDMGRIAELATPVPPPPPPLGASGCGETVGGDPCACGPSKARRRRNKRSRHRLLALVQEKEANEQMEEAQDGEEDDLQQQEEGMVLAASPTDLASWPNVGPINSAEQSLQVGASASTASRKSSKRASSERPARAVGTASRSVIGVGDASTIGADADGATTATVDPSAAITSGTPIAATGSASGTQLPPPVPERRSLRRAVSQARSLGKGDLLSPLSGRFNTAGVEFPATAADISIGGPKRPTRLLRGAATSGVTTTPGVGGEQPSWKVVPIKVLQLGI